MTTVQGRARSQGQSLHVNQAITNAVTNNPHCCSDKRKVQLSSLDEFLPISTIC